MMETVLREPPVVNLVRGLCLMGSVTLMASGIPEIVSTISGRVAADPSRAQVYASMLADHLVGIWFSMLLGDILSIRLRILGLLFTSTYITVLIRHCHGANRRIVLRTVGAALAIFIALFVGVKTLEPASHMHVLGFVNTLTAVSFAAAPLLHVKSILAVSDASSLNAPMSGALLFTASAWSTYGFILGNGWMVAPNILNVFLAALQMALIFAYPRHGSLTTSAVTPQSTHERFFSGNEVIVSPNARKAQQANEPHLSLHDERGPGRRRGGSGPTTTTGSRPHGSPHAPGQTPVELGVVGSPALAAMRRTAGQAGRMGAGTSHHG